MKTTELKAGFQSGKYAELLKDIYIDESVLEYQKERYVKAIESFEELFGVKDVEIYSAPGRSEIGGNHTDHQCGRVLAASINLDVMFVDEGFGSLDEDSLNQAIRSLNDLAQGQRLVGIISHVGELKDRIERKIIVTKKRSSTGVGSQVQVVGE